MPGFDENTYDRVFVPQGQIRKTNETQYHPLNALQAPYQKGHTKIAKINT